ncbi:hypothetical protein [Candidatus Poriferisocius sp.]|uniref:hypothetical protein n=1 Tax=Candidatus Poriferisocius sp. TaxID=3101276 RepID=UPI003B52EF8E
MSTAAAFFVFLLVMLALATLAIILDWMGKPIRRAFRPRTTGTPGWLATEGPMPAESPILEFAGQPAEIPNEPLALEPGELPDETLYREPAAQPQPSSPSGPWQAGDSIFKPTPRGTLPSITGVRRRYWKNLSEHRASVVFGEANRSLMAIGQAPQRFNPRTGSIEELSLPEPMLRHCWTTGKQPIPTWGDQGLDPYAQP